MAMPTRVVRPSLFWFVLLDGGIMALTRLALSEGAYEKAAEMSDGRLPPRPALQKLLVGAVVVHAGEALLAGRMARRRGLAPGGWRRQTFVVGFPSLLKLRGVADG
jgi:hypothetical protein